MKTILLTVLFVTLSMASVQAEVIEKTITWEFEGTTFSGAIVYDKALA